MQEKALSEQIADFISARAVTKLEALNKRIAKERTELDGANAVAIAEFETASAQKLREESAKFTIEHWLTDAAARAKQINMVTHAPKYTHGDAKGSGVYMQATDDSTENPGLLHSGSVECSQMDIVGNAAALDVAGLLQLSENGVSLLDRIENGDASAIAGFSKNEKQLADWMAGFSDALKAKELSSHKFSKQIYFPLSDGSYHLISPLFASSLAHEVHQRIIQTRYSEESIARRRSRRNGKYADGVIYEYPSMAAQTYGGTKPQNISQLNSVRGGRGFLFTCQPPVWKRQIRPPMAKTAFWKAYDRRVWRTAKTLREYLERIEPRGSNQLFRKRRDNFVDELISEFLQLAAEIRNLSVTPGWSAESALPFHEQLWLDPMRPDAAFQAEREKLDWVNKVAAQFSNWLNSHLNRSKTLAFGDVEFSVWKNDVEGALKADLRAM
ncbi:MAG: type I-F CRISPR-associated protein Csy1 [Burkholderiaceae bacterium]